MGAEVTLRAVEEADLPIFFAQQADEEARRRAAFPGRAREEFFAHWRKILADPNCILRTVMFEGRVAGNVVCWGMSGERNVGYWLGREFWGMGVGTAALRLFLGELPERPLVARVATENVASIRVLEKCGFVAVGEDRFVGIDGEEATEMIFRRER